MDTTAAPSWRRRFGRRLALAAGVGAGSTLALPSRLLAASPTGRAGASDPKAALAAESVYFEETGHTVGGAFWPFWRAFGLDAFGYPISEAIKDGGVTNQYFQRARFELAADGSVQLGLLGVEAGATEAPPGSEAALAQGGPDSRVVPETGHTVSGAFLTAYERWKVVLGPPIGPEHAVSGGYIQYFAHARLEWDPFGGTRLGLLGSELAARRGVDTRPVAAPANVVTWSDVVAALIADEGERRALGARVSGGKAFLPAFDEHWISVSIAQQRVTAYEHTKTVLTDLCSTGLIAKGLTPVGIFAINRRVPNETMDSRTIGILPGDARYYRLENVLYTQYFDDGGAALHYAWWHNNFGHPMSYGCVNLRLPTAQWFWNWANIGTRVVVA